jgi:hypothetical protein
MPNQVETEYRLTTKHAEHDLEYWRDIRALCKSGKELLRKREVFDRVSPGMPRAGGDLAGAERRAFYVNHLATVIDTIVAGLACDEIVMVSRETKEGEPTEAGGVLGRVHEVLLALG